MVLTGGACVFIYIVEKYLSQALDFIETRSVDRKKLKKALAEIGFGEHNRYFVHSGTEFFLEFPAGPLAVGREPVKEMAEVKYQTGILRLLSTTDSVKDRLAA